MIIPQFLSFFIATPAAGSLTFCLMLLNATGNLGTQEEISSLPELEGDSSYYKCLHIEPKTCPLSQSILVISRMQHQWSLFHKTFLIYLPIFSSATKALAENSGRPSEEVISRCDILMLWAQNSSHNAM